MSGETDARVGTPTDVGLRLRAAREAKQLSLRDIADTTKISIGALEALEENDVAWLPGGIYSRAFVRSYAAEVGLDPEQTMRDFMAQVPSEGITERTEHDNWSHEHDVYQNQQRMARTVLTLVLVGVPMAALLFFFGMRACRRAPGHPRNRLRRSSRRRRRLVWIHQGVPTHRPRSNRSRRHG